MSYRPPPHRQARIPLTGADVLRRTDNLNTMTTREMRVLNEDGSAPVENTLMSIGSGGIGQMRFSQARLTEDGSLDLPGTLDVAGATTLDGATTIAGALRVSGAAEFTGAVAMGANLVIDGNLTVTGAINGSTSSGSSGGVQKILAESNITVTPANGIGIVTVGLAPSVSVTGNLAAGGNVDATGDGNFGGDVDVAGEINASSAVITGRLETMGFLKAAEAQIAGPLDVDGALEAKAGITVTTGAINALTSTVNAATGNFSNGLAVTSAATMAGSVSVGEDLTVAHDLSANALNVETNATVGADLTVAGTVRAADLEISNGFRIDGAFQAQSAIIDTNLLVNGDLDVSGTIFHRRKFNPAIVADISAGEGIQISHPEDQDGMPNKSIFIISAPGGGGSGGGAIYNGGANIEITGSGPTYDINVDIDRDLDMNGYDIKNVDMIELVTTAGNAEDPRISFRNAGALEAARIEFNQSSVIDPVLRVAGPLVEIDASGATTTAGVKLIAGQNTLTLTTDRVQLGLPLLDISGAQIRYDGTDLVLDNTNPAGGYKIDGIFDVAGTSDAADYTHILTYNNTSGEVRKMPVPTGVDISAGTNIAVDEIGAETVVRLEISSDIDMRSHGITNVTSVKGDTSLTVGTASELASIVMSDSTSSSGLVSINGKVGIGTNTPTTASTLDVSGIGITVTRGGEFGGGILRFAVNSGETYIQSGIDQSGASAAPLHFGPYSVPFPWMTLTETGSLGIGTKTPTEKLEVAGRVKAAGALLTGVPTRTVNNPYVLTVDDTTGEIQQQPAGGGGGASDLSLLLNQPGAPTGETTTPGSAEILIKWTTNPSQTSVNFMPEKLPRIVALKVQVAGGTTYTNTANLPGSAAVDVVKGIVLIIGSGSNGIVTRGGEKVFAIYMASAPSTVFDVDIWYEGYGDAAANKLSVTGVSFAAGAGPSAPQNVTTSKTDTNFGIVTVTYGAPIYTLYVDDSNKQTASDPGAPTITKYTMDYTPQSAPRRYNGPYNPTKQTKDNITTLSTSLTGLYPDTTYSWNLWATNSLGIAGIKANGTFSTNTNPDLAPTQFIDTNPSTFSESTYATPIFLNGTQINDPVYFTTTLMGANTALTIPSLGPLPIHVSETRGSSLAGIMELKGSINGGPTATLAVGGFGTTTGSNTTGDIKFNPVTPSTRTDVGSSENSGFYQTERYQIITHAYKTDRTERNTITLTQSFPNTSVADKTKTINFYTDNLLTTTTPTITFNSAPSFTTSGYHEITGILISNGWSKITLNLTLGGMGTTFHAKDPITYSFIGNTGVLASSLPSGRDTLYTTVLDTPSGNADSYYYRPSISVTATNSAGKLKTDSYQLPFTILDPLSYNRKNTDTRIRAPTSVFNPTETLYTDHTKPLSDPDYKRECMLRAGFYVGNGTPDAFINYSAIFAGADLTGTNGSGSGGLTGGYRYVALQFNISADSWSKAVIAITFTSGIKSTTSGSTKQLQTTDGANIDVYYRSGGTGTTQSIWINANSKMNINNFSGNYPITNTSTSLGGQRDTDGLTISGSTATYEVTIPAQFDASAMFVCVGVPDGKAIGVGAVSCKLA